VRSLVAPEDERRGGVREQSLAGTGKEGPIMSDLISNEKIKLTASWMNTMSGAIFTAGVALPIIGQVTGASHLEIGVLAVLMGVCFVGAVGIHWLGTHFFGGLDDFE
jgi:VIT1/CCC1 family predicted Fe2+/Mn2+ transporter